MVNSLRDYNRETLLAKKEKTKARRMKSYGFRLYPQLLVTLLLLNIFDHSQDARLLLRYVFLKELQYYSLYKIALQFCKRSTKNSLKIFFKHFWKCWTWIPIRILYSTTNIDPQPCYFFILYLQIYKVGNG
jgi:hypothetical protein